MERTKFGLTLEASAERRWERRLRVAQLKEAVRRGLYDVSPDDIAASLLERAGVDFLFQHA